MTQSTESNNGDKFPATEPIDLIDLILQLWQGKRIIVLSVIIASVIAVIYLFVAKEEWTSTATLAQPDGGQLVEYSNRIMTTLYDSNAPSLDEMKAQFVARMNATLSAISEMLVNQEEAEKLTITSAAGGQFRVSYTGQTAQDARQRLAQYINQASDTVNKDITNDLAVSINGSIRKLRQSLVVQEKVAQEQKVLDIAKITQALKVATEANITTPIVQQLERPAQDYMFMLGSDALTSLVRNEATRPLGLSGEYYKTRQSLLNMIDLQKSLAAVAAKKGSFQTYRYVMQPTLPIRRDSPKRALVLFLAVLFGGLVGAGIVLGRNALSTHKKPL